MGEGAADGLRRFALAGACAVGDGVLAGALDLTVRHVGTRHQFGKPLVSFQIVQDYWRRAFAGQTSAKWTIRNPAGSPFADADSFWRRALHDGFIAGTGAELGARDSGLGARDSGLGARDSGLRARDSGFSDSLTGDSTRDLRLDRRPATSDCRLSSVTVIG